MSFRRHRGDDLLFKSATSSPRFERLARVQRPACVTAERTSQSCARHGDVMSTTDDGARVIVIDKLPEREREREKYPYFGDNRISSRHSVGRVEGRLRAHNQLNPSGRFDATPACD